MTMTMTTAFSCFLLAQYLMSLAFLALSLYWFRFARVEAAAGNSLQLRPSG